MYRKTIYLLAGCMLAVIALGMAGCASAGLSRAATPGDPVIEASQDTAVAPPVENAGEATPANTNEAAQSGLQATGLDPTTTAENPTLLDTPAPAGEPEPQIQTGDQPEDLIETITYLNARSQAFYEVSGWIHIRREIYDFIDRGDAIDLLRHTDHYIDETWQRLNDDGLIFEFIYIMKPVDGEIVQMSTCQDGKSWNSISGETKECSPYKWGDPDGELFDRYLEYAAENPHRVEMVEMNGVMAVKITATDIYMSPIVLDEYEQRITEMVETNYFDVETGVSFYTENVAVFENGTTQVFGRVLTDVELGEAPPANILSLTEGK